MFRRQLLRIAVTLGIVVATVFGVSSAANAAPTSFYASSVHANGYGALAAAFQGGLIWGNRSVTLNTPRLYVAAGECATVEIFGMQGDTVVDGEAHNNYCPTGGGQWYRFSDILLDGSRLSGGVTRIVIHVIDETHYGLGRTICYRTASSCIEDNAVPPGEE